MGGTEFLSFQLVDEESNIKPTYSSDETCNALVSRYAPQKLSQGSVAFVSLQTATFC